MKIAAEMEKDIKYLLDAVDEFQRKHDGIYVSVHHCLHDKNIVASATISSNEISFPSISKWSNGEYTK
jgi:hypothetical protein